MSLCGILFLATLLTYVPDARAANRTDIFDVRKMGAVSDGKTDDSAVFLRAWKNACERGGFSRVYVPPGTYMLLPVDFVGPCKGPVEILLKGVVKASDSPETLHFNHWISFRHVDGLTIRGGGTFDGQGASAWPYNKCAKNPYCKTLPISLRFDFVNTALIKSIKFIDSKYFHINVFGSHDVKFFQVKIIAPADSPNTDGIHIGSSTGVRIYNSLIATGDDCISLGDGSKEIHVTGVNCGPGHGISVGSLGRTQNEAPVDGFYVRNCTFTGTDNGIRIKTWPASFPGVVSNVHFKNIRMKNVGNPVVIDQEYCPWNLCKKGVPSLVKISNVTIDKIYGTSSTPVALKITCSPSVPCQNVQLGEIHLTYNGPHGPAVSACSNVLPKLTGIQMPHACTV